MKRCTKCGKRAAKLFNWEGFRDICWPCKAPMMQTALPGVVARLEAEFASPAVQEAMARVLSNDPEDKS